MNAAIIYQHAAPKADRVIAEGLDARMQAAQKAAAETLEDAEMGKSEAEAGLC